MEQNAANPGEVLRANFERLWKTKDARMVRKIVAPHAIAHSPCLGTCAGVDYPHRVDQLMHELVPDIWLDITAHGSQGDLVFISWHASGTLGRRRLEWDGVDRFHLDRHYRDGTLADEVQAIYDTSPILDALAADPRESGRRAHV